MSDKTILVWFRNDLRIHDNEILLEATKRASKIVPVYCFDPRYYTTTEFDTLKTGSVRANFIVESVIGLKRSLQKIGGDLIIQMGKPEDILPEIAKKYQVTEVYHHREVAFEETEISSLVEAALWKLQINLKHFIGHTLYHKEDLPFPIKDIPDAFATFKKKIERESTVRPCFETPQEIHIPEDLDAGSVPELSDLGLETPRHDERAILQFMGGEAEGLKRMYDYLWHRDRLKRDKESRNYLLNPDFSSKLSPWIALGCLSTREVYWEIKKYERESNDTSYAMILELLWRDYFRFMFKKHASKLAAEQGIGIQFSETENQKELFKNWKEGKTGVPFIDAVMHELNATGYISDVGRRNTASYLVRDLKINWTWGAAYFEEKLIDYSPASNWGNWAHIAGVGYDPKAYRQFDVLQQAKEFDPKGDYVDKWLNELEAVK